MEVATPARSKAPACGRRYLDRVDENTIMVVPTFGVTYTGAYEPVEAIARALDQLQAETGLDIDIHVDGASGAFLAPFCAPDVVFDFRLPRVKSISTWGTNSAWPRSEPAGSCGETARICPRSSCSTSTTWAATCRCSRSISPARQARSSPSTTTSCASATRATSAFMSVLRIGQYLAAEIVKADHSTAVREQSRHWHPGRNVADPRRRGPWLHPLRPGRPASGQGWQVPAYTLTGAAANIAVQRILVRLGVSQDLASLLLDDSGMPSPISPAPVTVPMTKEESGGFSHL